jgi:histidyl-tRNA synthetase
MILNDNMLPSRKRPVAIIIIPDREKTSFDAINSSKNNKLYYYGLNLSKSLRDKDIQTLFYHPPPSSRQSSLKTILSNIVKTNASHVIFVGENEIAKGEVTIKDLDNKIQEGCKIEDILQYIIKRKLN